MTLDSRTRWYALIVLCLGTLMIVLDSTIVNVALPSIRADLGFSETSLAWVVNAYLLTFGGFLLLGGRLGDLYGHRRLFLSGIALFTVASLACGLSTSQELADHRARRAGRRRRVASAVSLSLTMNLFTEPAERAKAMGIFGFVASGGGSIGVLLGGVLTDVLDWHWIFLVNIPIGIAVVLLSLRLLPGAQRPGRRRQARRRRRRHGDRLADARRLRDRQRQPGGLDLGADARAARRRRRAARRCSSLIESRVSSPLMPLRPLPSCATSRPPTSSACSGPRRCSRGSSSRRSTCSSCSATPRSRSASRSCPATSSWASSRSRVSAKLVMRFGIKPPLATGLLVAAAGLLLFARAPVDGNFVIDVLPSMILLGFGAGIAFNPVLLAAMSDVAAGGVGARLGHRQHLVHDGRRARPGRAREPRRVAHRHADRRRRQPPRGAHRRLSRGFLVGALFAVSAAAIGGLLLRTARSRPMAHEAEPAPATRTPAEVS